MSGLLVHLVDGFVAIIVAIIAWKQITVRHRLDEVNGAVLDELGSIGAQLDNLDQRLRGR